MEKWTTVNGTDGQIEISDCGRVRSLLRDGRILKQQPDKKGYMRVRITINRQKYSFKVHRLVASAYIPNPSKLPQVNHKDGNKANNAAANLEWTSNIDNARHAIDNGLWGNVFKASARANEAQRTPVVSIDATTGEKRYFDSVRAAERHFNSRHISDVLNGKRDKAAGQYFERLGGGSK